MRDSDIISECARIHGKRGKDLGVESERYALIHSHSLIHLFTHSLTHKNNPLLPLSFLDDSLHCKFIRSRSVYAALNGVQSYPKYYDLKTSGLI